MYRNRSTRCGFFKWQFNALHQIDKQDKRPRFEVFFYAFKKVGDLTNILKGIFVRSNIGAIYDLTFLSSH